MSDRDGTTRLWSDVELDEALDSLHAERRDPGSALAAARAKLLAAASGDPIPGARNAASASADQVSTAADPAAARVIAGGGSGLCSPPASPRSW